jgi:hypothetical protein
MGDTALEPQVGAGEVRPASFFGDEAVRERARVQQQARLMHLRGDLAVVDDLHVAPAHQMQLAAVLGGEVRDAAQRAGVEHLRGDAESG